MKLNLLVIRTKNPEALKTQYECIGFEFDYHQHGNAPFHYTSNKDEFVFEIYPLTKSMDKGDNSVRLGFEINNLNLVIEKIKDSNWILLSDITETEWGPMAIIQDLDGRKIELKQEDLFALPY